MPTPCYLIEPTGEAQLWLRRYSAEHAAWTCEEGWHSAMTAIARTQVVPSETHAHCFGIAEKVDDYIGDPRWPTVCEKGCGYAFTADDRWQVFYERMMTVTAAVPGAALDVGAETNLRDCPPGAIWYADWAPERWRGPDGHTLCCKLPDGHEWMIDSVANNCTRPDDAEHRCWCRTGEPPYLDVGKSTCKTCEAGAGSIASSGYHGFLQSGILT